MIATRITGDFLLLFQINVSYFTTRTLETPSIAFSSSSASLDATLSRSMRVYAYSPLLLFVISAMFRPSAPRILVNWLIMFGIFLWQMAIRPTATQVPISQLGKFTEFLIFPFSRKSLTSFTAITAQFSSDSSVDAPRCGAVSYTHLFVTII